MSPFVEVTDLQMYFPVQKGFLEATLSKKREFVHAVDGVSFTIGRGETFGLVGESGSGKTTTGRLLIHLLEPTSGRIIVDGENIATVDSDSLRTFQATCADNLPRSNGSAQSQNDDRAGNQGRSGHS